MGNPLDSDKAFAEAVEALRKRLPMTKDQWLALSEQARKRAFTVAHVSQADVIQYCLDQLTKAVEEPGSFADFKASIADKLKASWGTSVANPGARIETIFRTNVMSAYSSGRQKQMDAPAIRKARPYRKFVGICDNRQSSICAKCDGVILPADDPWWATHTPLLHHNCRSTVISLRTSQAEKLGITKSPPKDAADQGFGSPDSGEDWEPDLSGYDPALRAKLKG